MKGYHFMPKKVELQQHLRQRTQELEALKIETMQLQRINAYVLRAMQVSKEDLDRALSPVTLCHETGWELAERYEQGLKRARQRLEMLWSALSSQSELNLLDPLWKPSLSGEEQLSAYLQQSPGKDMAQ
jgi:exonuclease VII small subunit